MSELVEITRIEFQNPRKKIYALYSGDTFLFEVLEDTLVHFTISKGISFSNEQLDAVIQYNNLNTCLNQAYAFLRRRPHLTKEIIRKLKERKFESKIIEQTIEKLKQRNYLNDREFIKIFIQDAIKQKKNGPLLIKKKLAEKGAAFAIVDEITAELFNSELQKNIALELILKKNKNISEPDSLKRKQKLVGFLQNRGFNWPLIEQALAETNFQE